MQTSLKRTFFLTVVGIVVAEFAFSRSSSATEYSYPAVDQSEIDDRGLPCFMQTEEGSTIDLSRVCMPSEPESQDQMMSTQMPSEASYGDERSMFYEMQQSSDPDSSSEPSIEDYPRY